MTEEKFPWDKKEECIRGSANFVLYATDKNEAVLGFIVGTTNPDRRNSFLRIIFVIENQRRKGLASMLVHEFMKKVKEVKAAGKVFLVPFEDAQTQIFPQLQDQYSNMEILDLCELEEELLELLRDMVIFGI